jgi:hypothetical protein
MTFGRIIPHLHIDGTLADYPVLNERDARASAGIMLMLGVFSSFEAFFLKNISYLQITVVLFFIEFLLRVINPYFAPFYTVGRLLVANQKPEWVGAIQKRFAWSLGLGMASVVLILLALNMRGLVIQLFCFTCLILMWLESACGICVGCKLYHAAIRAKILPTPTNMPACPGGVCAVPKKKH